MLWGGTGREREEVLGGGGAWTGSGMMDERRVWSFFLSFCLLLDEWDREGERTLSTYLALNLHTKACLSHPIR